MKITVHEAQQSADQFIKDIYYGKVHNAMNSIKGYLNYIEDVVIRKGTADWGDVGSLNSLASNLEEWAKWADEEVQEYKGKK